MSKRYKDINVENLEILVERVKKFENIRKLEAIERLGITPPTFYSIQEKGKATKSTIAKLKERSGIE